MHLPAIAPKKPAQSRLNDLDGREWVQATKSFLFQQGLGHSHPETRIERQHPAPFSYRDAERLIRLFSKDGEAVLDPFCGVGSTLKACALSGRRGTGFELSKTFFELSKQRLQEEVDDTRARRTQTAVRGDARKLLEYVGDDSFSFILTSPPYWNILSKDTESRTRYRKGSKPYSTDKRDFGCIEDYDEFVCQLAEYLNSLKRVLQPKRYMAVMVADFRHGEELYALQADLITALRRLNKQSTRKLVLQGIKIIAQNHKKLYPYGFPSTYVPNIHHHYVLIFRNIVADVSAGKRGPSSRVKPDARKGRTSGASPAKRAATRTANPRKRTRVSGSNERRRDVRKTGSKAKKPANLRRKKR